MAKPYDAAIKELVEKYPADWVRQLGLPVAGPVEVIDADLSTVTAEADKVFRIQDATPWLLHLELQASRDSQLARRLLRYNVLLSERHGLPVHTAVVLLRPEADDPALTGTLNYRPPHGGGFVEFGYQVVRVWQERVESLLAGGLGTLPLALLSDVSSEQLPKVVGRMEERLTREAAPSAAATLWASSFILMGLRYPQEFVANLLQGVRGMKESSTYQAILAEGEARGRAEGEARGRAEEARRLLLQMGGKRLGPPDAGAKAKIEAISDVERLEQLTERVLEIASWDALWA